MKTEKPTVDQLAELHDQIRDGRVTRAMFQCFLEKPELVFGNDAKSVSAVELTDYPVVIDRSLSWSDLLAATKISKKYVKVDFTEKNFPLGQKPDYEYDLVLVELDHASSTVEVLAELTKQGLERPEVEDVLAFEATYPDVQRELPIVAFIVRPWCGPDGFMYVPYLRKDENERCLRLGCFYYDWSRGNRFLARRPRKPAPSAGQSK